MIKINLREVIKFLSSKNVSKCNDMYSGVCLLASRILHEKCLLIGELANGRTKLTL